MLRGKVNKSGYVNLGQNKGRKVTGEGDRIRRDKKKKKRPRGTTKRTKEVEQGT